MLTLDNIFAGVLPEDEVWRRVQGAGLHLTSCLDDDEYAHLTIAVEADGQPVWTLALLANGRYMLVDFDCGELPEAFSPELDALLNRLKDMEAN